MILIQISNWPKSTVRAVHEHMGGKNLDKLPETFIENLITLGICKKFETVLK